MHIIEENSATRHNIIFSRSAGWALISIIVPSAALSLDYDFITPPCVYREVDDYFEMQVRALMTRYASCARDMLASRRFV